MNTQADSFASVSVARGNIYLAREICDRYFSGALSVALLARAEQILIMPLTRESGGGLLLKMRNARGDRIVHAQEFFREQGLLENMQERKVSIHWNEESAALVIADLYI